MTNEFENKTILITGGTGSIGSALVKTLLNYKPKTIRIFSRDQNRQYELAEELNHPSCLRFFIGDIRDEKRLDFAMEGVDIVFHAAALKHVPSCEYNPFEAVKTNIIGSQNVVDIAIKHKVEKAIGISTDKVVNPTSVMGVSKMMMEKIFISANYYRGAEGCKFACVRFGNVAWSTASVLPIWQKQIVQNGSIDITDKNMTRFLMSRQQAAELVIKAAEAAQGAEIFVLKMSSVKILNLAKIFLEKYAKNGKNVSLNLIGNRGGEKMHEELFSEADLQHQIFENKAMYILVPTASSYLKSNDRKYDGFKKTKNKVSYSSRKFINDTLIKKII